MLKGSVIIPEIVNYLRVNKPNNVRENEINEIKHNHANLYHLMDNIFSILHEKEVV